MAASLNDIYRSIGELTSGVRGLAARIDENEKRNVAAIQEANESRANVHRRLDDIAMRTAHLESDVTAVKRQNKEMQAVTDDVKRLRQQAIGAGTLGQWLLRIGGIILSAASGAAAAWYAMTGRPPP